MDALTLDVEHAKEVLTETAFTRLLVWLDDGTDSRGEIYLEMRRRLVEYFDRRNRRFADELADETLNRIGRTLETSGTIAVTPPARYCYVVARFVLLEDIRRERRYVHIEEARVATGSGCCGGATDDTAATDEQRLECLDRCLRQLKPDQRELAVEYYRDAKRQRIDRRRELAKRLGISTNALGIRACRIRSTLESCIGGCCQEAMKGFHGLRPMTVGSSFRVGYAFLA
jgi:DNA-directed RNA polymerase specialized sigma24 family protein